MHISEITAPIATQQVTLPKTGIEGLDVSHANVNYIMKIGWFILFLSCTAISSFCQVSIKGKITNGQHVIQLATVVLHGAAPDLSFIERREAISMFFTKENPDSLRLIVIKNFKPDYIFLDYTRQDLQSSTIQWIRSLGEVVYKSDLQELIRLKKQ
jgi:hypothetical protein